MRSPKFKQLSDAPDTDIGRAVFCKRFLVLRVVTLSREHRGDAVLPSVFNGLEDAQLVINHDIVLRGIKALHRCQFFFFMNKDQHMSVKGFPQTCAFHLAWLEHGISIGQDRHTSPTFESPYHIECSWIQSCSEGILYQPVGHAQ